MKNSLSKKTWRPGKLLAGICFWGALVFCSMNFPAAPVLAQTGNLDASCLPSPALTASTIDPAEQENILNTEVSEVKAATGTAENKSERKDESGDNTRETVTQETISLNKDNTKETVTGETMSPNDQKEREILVFLDGFQIVFDVQPALEKNRVLVPFRALFEALQAQVNWDNASKTVSVSKGNHSLKLTVHQQEALLNGETHTLDVPPLLFDNRVLVPLRFIGEFFGELQVNWEAAEKKVYLETGLARYHYLEREFVSPDKDIEKTTARKEEEKAQEADNEKDTPEDSFVVGVHAVELSPSLQPKVSLAQGQVGKAVSIHNYASYFQNPVAIINGTYFNPTGKYPDPYGTIITDGEIVQTNNLGTTVGFTAEKEIRIADLEVDIKGLVWENNLVVHSWSAFGLNHTPSSEEPSIYIFTAARGGNIGFDYGTAVIIDQEGTILDCVNNTDASMPPEGYVITFTEYLQKEALQHFIPGRQVTYEIIFKDKEGDRVDWSDVQEAFTCWPLIIKNNQIVAPASKVPTVRSALALDPGGRIILISSTPATLGQLGVILQKDLGVAQAINLDGGGSAGLLLHGLTITKPSRLIPNALVFHQDDSNNKNSDDNSEEL